MSIFGVDWQWCLKIAGELNVSSSSSSIQEGDHQADNVQLEETILYQDLQSEKNDIVLFAPFGLDYIGEEEEKKEIFEEDQKHAWRNRRRKARRLGRKKERKNFQHKGLPQYAEMAGSNIGRHKKLKSPHEKSHYKKREKGGNRKRCKSERRGRFSPSTLSAIYLAPAYAPTPTPARQLTIGQLSIRWDITKGKRRVRESDIFIWTELVIGQPQFR